MKIVFKFSLIAGFFLYIIPLHAQKNYLGELLPGTKISFQHWDLGRSEISGYSYFRYEIHNEDGKKFILEKNENTKPDGKVFTKKTLWFDANTGEPLRYEEEDLRKDFRINNTYLGQIVNTSLYKAGKVLEFTTNLSYDNAIPFEMVFFFLRKNFHQILQSKDFSFTLFLPLLAIELEEKGLPRSMSMIKMLIELKEETSIESPLGRKKARKIIVLPQSAFLRAFLPREKTHFEFIISKEVPNHILQFKTGKTMHILTKFLIPK